MKPPSFTHPGQKNHTRSKNNIMWTFFEFWTVLLLLTQKYKFLLHHFITFHYFITFHHFITSSNFSFHHISSHFIKLFRTTSLHHIFHFITFHHISSNYFAPIHFITFWNFITFHQDEITNFPLRTKGPPRPGAGVI